MSELTARDILKKSIMDLGYDGLCGDEFDGCGCVLSDLAPCNSDALQCYPGYKVPCDDECGLGCKFHIVRGKRFKS